MNTHKGHRQRVKSRYLAEGLDSFEDHEILEMLLFYCIPMKDTNDLAHRMLNEYGSLANLFEADVNDICKRCGVSENTAIFLSLIPSLTRRYYKSKLGEKVVINSSSKAGEYAIALFAGRTYEAFYVICLDANNRVKHATLLQEGTIDEVNAYPRLVVEAAIRHKANSVILMHNHPGGTLYPSSMDIKLTKRIVIVLEAISINVMDHIIVADDRYFSFAENKLFE